MTLEFYSNSRREITSPEGGSVRTISSRTKEENKECNNLSIVIILLVQTEIA